MRKTLTRKEVRAILTLSVKLDDLRYGLERDDVELNYGNGTASGQLDCAVAALDTILQEYDLNTFKKES